MRYSGFGSQSHLDKSEITTLNPYVDVSAPKVKGIDGVQ